MTRDDYIWVGIKVLGLYLIVLAILALPQLLFSAYMLVVCRDFVTLHEPLLDKGRKFTEMIAGSHFAHGMKALAQVVLCGGFGIYFLRRGAAVLSFVSRSAPQQGGGSVASGDADAQPSDGSDAAKPSESEGRETE